MLKYYFLIAFALTSQISKAQIVFEYDVLGNRILRKRSGALPVTLISFTATKVSGEVEGSTALLNWQTSSETNSDRFDIERSLDGKKWMNIGNATASGDKKSSSSYSFPDKKPMDGENLYRLKMIDRDGSFSFSRIQSVYFDTQISLYPNPVKDLLKINGAASGKVQLINNAGKVVFSSGNIPTEGIDMVNLSAGVYLVRITHKDGSSTVRKVVKQ
ncbi:T9SS type A sorting domain-containing protein [Dyadobacter sp. NIV53]|uniref:T9SS type A sorting domain-containing protein n=1 Tax=Dyadobacter sp. NIV53 TaxID=2861765 RepID=UPI001C883855|nr:T9SS type A sorting domain-containing protein [Dyadobacter sp. NIV53]